MAETKVKKGKPRLRFSLNQKAFMITLLLTLFIGVTVLIAGFLIYIVGIAHEYYVSTWNQANAEAAVLEQTDYRRICDEIIGIYDSIPEAERGDGKSPVYKEHFVHVLNEDYVKIQEAMQGLKSRNGPMNAFIVAMEQGGDRMIYLIDSDPDIKTTCYPGTWDIYPKDNIDGLINGLEPSALEKRQGIHDRVQAVFTDIEGYGPRVTAGATLYTTDKYAVVICVDEKLSPITNNARIFLGQYVILLLTVTLIASFMCMLLMRKYMVSPLVRMAHATLLYGRDQNKEKGTRYFDDLKISTGDEIEQLAYALRDMEEEVADYMNDLKRVTAETEHINTELSLAARIQRSMLTDEFPPFPDHHEFDIYATMEPAKEIGGDFYDMIMIDDDHLVVAIADVSGKGIPAALVMMSTKILLADGVRDSLSPALVLKNVNNTIYMNNPEEMFITCWLGILELSTGRLTASNAGHEYPVMIHADGSVETVIDKHGFVIGGFEDMKYTDYEIQMEKGDRLLVYTDGVTEATSVDDELFGLSRVKETISECDSTANPKEIIRSIRHSIREFTVGMMQSDDLTMLCFEYLGPSEDETV